ncbi:hypothetical protein AVEN_5719-1 [Araneus ventricosus]|uniref:Uncharacterized protein n=1 Tax=Araneus ventricosus TaxID=182803 RepID=A0A4Y2WMF2_ARAVE|nr:hypothetical protein AVEN_5719-1 [Araneus ventricosus]
MWKRLPDASNLNAHYRNVYNEKLTLFNDVVKQFLSLKGFLNELFLTAVPKFHEKSDSEAVQILKPTDEIIRSDSYLYQHPILKQRECFSGPELRILNHGQMMRTTSEAAPHFPNLRDTSSGDDDLPLRMETTTRFTCKAFLRWNRVSYLEASELQAKILTLGHRGPR